MDIPVATNHVRPGQALSEQTRAGAIADDDVPVSVNRHRRVRLVGGQLALDGVLEGSYILGFERLLSVRAREAGDIDRQPLSQTPAWVTPAW